ncbi:MAG: UDP-N-acetylglucosamine 2-epimerase (non-hydrolyzing) [Anaerolineaceae bacterium]|nr:UDP-N-acetylglucosamine 2-epimerase (non-hydrolyzing) [Anaerolineaceae bacterium]
MIIDVIAGARPNFMKVAALFAVADQFPNIELRLIHTGQHYDANMSDVFFSDLGLPKPIRHLDVGSGSHAIQTAEVMTRYEQWVMENRPDLTLVVGDVNSTVACAIVASKLHIPVAHVEAGLRSFDRAMPEEINRVLTDSISDFLFVTEPSGMINLAREGRPAEAIHMVGHVMIDTLLRMREKAAELLVYQRYGKHPGEYAFMTMHRPSNVDDPTQLGTIIDQLAWLSQRIAIIFPVHPRTRNRLNETGLMSRLEALDNMYLIDPVGYLEAVCLVDSARMVVTDSGGLQEESSALGVPCLTLRDSTERPITITEGTNTLIADDWDLFRQRVTAILDEGSEHATTAIPYWDGRAGERILRILSEQLA